jgi:hypothetical protein
LIPALGWIALFATGDSPSWLVVASIPLTFFGVLGLLLVEAYVERRSQGAGSVPMGRTAAAA